MPDKEIDKAVSGVLCSTFQAEPPCHMEYSWYHPADDIERSQLFPHFLRKWETFIVSLINKIWHISIQYLNRNFCFLPNSVSFNNSMISFSFHHGKERGKFESF